MWGGCRSPTFSSSAPSSSPVIAPPMFHPFPPVLLFPSLVKFSKEVCSAPHIAQQKMTTSCKNWRGPNTVGPHCVQSWRGRVPYGGCAYDLQLLNKTSALALLPVLINVPSICRVW